MCHRVLVPLVLALLTMPNACVQRRVVRSSGMLLDLPGSQGGIRPDRPPQTATAQSWETLLTQPGPGNQPAASASASKTWRDVEGQPLRQIAPDGSVKLISRTPGHVMYHLTQTLANHEDDLLLDQVLSERSRAAYERAGHDPRQAVEFLKRHARDIADLFATFPMGEQTPGVLLEPLGNNAFRLTAPPTVRPDLRFTHFDVVIERGLFRLLMIR